MAFYTKKGDKGETCLLNPKSLRGRKVRKDVQMIRAIGALDEANAFLGLVKVFSGKRKLKKVIKGVITLFQWP